MPNPEEAARTERSDTERSDKPSTESGTRTAVPKGQHVGVYLPEPILGEMEREAKRQDRSLSYLARVAWTIARNRIRALPDAPSIGE